ncbi:MAG: glycosyltransferase [Lachnospiraceae bacterium]|nr:glycosyltransferase [Lachnospiraceae bacterium]
MKPLISVIIPIYQVEAYLRRAVDSVLNQTYRNLDIILVDDGSPDRCPKICDEYASKEARVRVIHKENGGLSDARNAGLDVAGGDYIAFLDSDDYYAPDFIEILYKELTDHRAQVALCRYQVTGPGSGELSPDFTAVSKQYKSGKAEIIVNDRQELLNNQYDALCEDATYYIVSWNKLYDAKLWKDIRFPKGRIHEDEATTYKVLDRAKRGVYVKLPLYAYFSAPSSITRDRFSLKRLDWTVAMTDRIFYFEKKELFFLATAALRARADGSIRYYYPLRSQVRGSKKQQAVLKDYVREALHTNRVGRRQERGFLTMKTRIGYRIFLFSPDLYRLLCLKKKEKIRL